MEGIKKSELIAARLKRASSAVKALNAEIDELKKKMAISIPAVTFIDDMDTVPVD